MVFVVEDYFSFYKFKMRQFVLFFPLLALVVVSLAGTATVEAATGLNPPVKLVWHYYKVTNTCDDAETYIRHQVEIFYRNDSSIAPKLLRLLYSDCMVNVSKNVVVSLFQ